MSLLLGALAAVLAGATLNDQLEKFPIGFWNYAPIEGFDEAKIQEWQDAGMTLTMGPEYTATPENVARMKKILDWSQARGIKVIICDPRTHVSAPLAEDYAARAAQVAGDFGSHPATFGFHLLDEPDTQAFQPVCDAVGIVKRAAPRCHPFVNLLPWHIGVNTRVGYSDWGAYLDDFLKKSQAEFLCYDCYSQMLPDKLGLSMYFRNLTQYEAAARRAGVPFWTTILSVGHYNYRCPSEDDIRWQFNSAIAYGAQGILYFFFYMRNPNDNYRLAPVDEFWDRTPLFDALKRTNKGFLKRYGRLFLDLRLEKAMQWPEALSGCRLFEPDDLIKEVSTGTHPLIVSRFKDKQGRPWLVLVNNSTDKSVNPAVTLNGAGTQAFQMNWEQQEVGVGVEKKEGCVRISHWLAPGQMEVFRIAPAP